MKSLILILMILLSSATFAQEKKVEFAFYDGIAIIGIVDNGGFSNFTGPNINATYKNSKFILGMLPSLRFKQDRGTPKNSFVTPNLGIGFTYSYKVWAIQLPLYYNAKTATTDGKWHIGLGFGLRLNELNKIK